MEYTYIYIHIINIHEYKLFLYWMIEYQNWREILLFSCVQLSATPWTAVRQGSYPSLSPILYSNSCPSSRWCHPTISSSVAPFSCAQSFPKSGYFPWVGSSQQVAKVLELQLQHQSFQWIFRVGFLLDGLVWSPCCPRHSQESSPAPQFESINSLAFSPLYGPTHIHTWLLKRL